MSTGHPRSPALGCTTRRTRCPWGHDCCSPLALTGRLSHAAAFRSGTSEQLGPPPPPASATAPASASSPPVARRAKTAANCSPRARLAARRSVITGDVPRGRPFLAVRQPVTTGGRPRRQSWAVSRREPSSRAERPVIASPPSRRPPVCRAQFCGGGGVPDRHTQSQNRQLSGGRHGGVIEAYADRDTLWKRDEIRPAPDIRRRLFAKCDY